jgi:hypothetical protein
MKNFNSPRSQNPSAGECDCQEEQQNIRTPPSKLPRRLNVPAPMHIAKKKSFLSAPRIVRGREIDL